MENKVQLAGRPPGYANNLIVAVDFSWNNELIYSANKVTLLAVQIAQLDLQRKI